jgi:hypothetical protein
MDDPIVKIFGRSTAVVIGTLTNFDAELHQTVRFTMVYRKRGAESKLVAGQLVPALETMSGQLSLSGVSTSLRRLFAFSGGF